MQSRITYRDEKVRAVSVLLNDLEALDGSLVADNVVELGRAVLFDPEKGTARLRRQAYTGRMQATYHGSS